MLLAVDCGNTNIVFALYEGNIQRANWRISTNPSRSADEYLVWLTQLMALSGLGVDELSGMIIANVVPEVHSKLISLAQRGLNLKPQVVGDEEIDLGIKINIDQPDQAGADRLVNAVAARDLYDLPAIILDFGTATTFDVLIKNTYYGGIIAPGVRLSLNTLSDKATLIPKIDLKKINKVIGNNTISAVRSGFFWGYAGLIDNIINLIKKETGKSFKVIITGGFSNLFKNSIKTKASHNQDITIKGLIKISKLIK